jgi:lycopene beta-cyclase
LPVPHQYDYIISGAGCAGLSLAVGLIEHGGFASKKILIVDQEEKKKNDRTWCFWEDKPGIFEGIVYQSWKKVWFYGDGFRRLLDLSPYTYKMIRGIDFYRYCFDRIRQQKNFEIRYGRVGSITGNPDHARIHIDAEEFRAEYIFNSILFEKPALRKNEVYMCQHFKGWVVETGLPAFDPETATLMDFRTGQEAGTTFVYVMPFSPTRALIEYTIFSNELLSPAAYDLGLREYLKNVLNITAYQVTSEEFGVIPMTNHLFPQRDGNIIYVGTAGGQTKGSSGYTFRFIQKHTAAIIEKLAQNVLPVVASTDHPRRFNFYDSVLLNILYYDKFPGQSIFTDLFRKNETNRVLKFLDNETSVREDWKIISSLPTAVFLKAAMQQIY